MNFKRISVITGHYGSGKTNTAVNLALKMASEGKKVTIVDLDIVNPYFRTADFKELFEGNNINAVLPQFANTNLDIPCLPGTINTVFDQKDSFVIIDVGGDDAGAIALGRFAKQIVNDDYDFFYVVNSYRYLTATPEEALASLRDIEAAARIKATGIINNSNLGNQTDIEIIKSSLEFAENFSDISGLPIKLTCVNKKYIDKISVNAGEILPVDIFVKTVWE